jgi:hypothetical protein
MVWTLKEPMSLHFVYWLVWVYHHFSSLLLLVHRYSLHPNLDYQKLLRKSLMEDALESPRRKECRNRQLNDIINDSTCSNESIGANCAEGCDCGATGVTFGGGGGGGLTVLFEFGIDDDGGGIIGGRGCSAEVGNSVDD